MTVDEAVCFTVILDTLMAALYVPKLKGAEDASKGSKEIPSLFRSFSLETLLPVQCTYK